MPALRQPLSILSRVLAAVLGGYAFTYSLTACLALALPFAKADAAVVASLPAFVVFTLAILWAFAARTVLRAWAAGLLAIPLGMIAFWPRVQEMLG